MARNPLPARGSHLQLQVRLSRPPSSARGAGEKLISRERGWAPEIRLENLSSFPAPAIARLIFECGAVVGGGGGGRAELGAARHRGLNPRICTRMLDGWRTN
jgi:hypothetical protein